MSLSTSKVEPRFRSPTGLMSSVGRLLAEKTPMPNRSVPQLGGLIVTPFAAIGVLAAVLVWEVEHVSSMLVAAAIMLGGLAIGFVIARHLRRGIDRLPHAHPGLFPAPAQQAPPGGGGAPPRSRGRRPP